MVSAISGSSQAAQISSSVAADNAVQEAAIEKQIQDKEDQAKAVQDLVQANKLQQDIAALKAKLDALKAADKTAAAQSQQSQSTPSTAALRQAEFDGENGTSKSFWI